MAVTFAVSEASGVLPFGASAELTTGGTFRSANGRLALNSFGPSNGYIATAPAAITDGWLRFNALIVHDSDDGSSLLTIRDDVGSDVFRIFTGSNGSVVKLQYWNGSAWADVGSSWGNVYTSTLVEYAIKITCGTGGTATVFVNGTQVATGSIGNGIANFQSALFYHADTTGGFTYAISEIIFTNSVANMIGSAVETEAPTGNGADSTDGTGAYTDLDEAVTSDVDTMIFSAAAERRSFTSPARTGTLDQVLGVGVAARANRGSSGPQKIKFYLRIGGTRYYSPDITLSLGFAGYQYVWAVNPATSLAWTPTDANDAALEWGIEAVT